MLKLYESTPRTNIMSLRSGGPIAEIVSAIINPNNLYIEGWFIKEGRSKDQLILLSNDIREVLPQGFVVNDRDAFSNIDDLVRLKEILDLKFELIGLKVNSENGKNYGKVGDYAYDTQGFFIQKLYASQLLVKNFNSGNLSIDRNQIIEVTNKRIVIQDPIENAQAKAPTPSLVG